MLLVEGGKDAVEDGCCSFGFCGFLLTVVSYILFILTLPFSLFVSVKVSVYSYFIFILSFNIIILFERL
jgi:hypothetical protein